MGSEFAHWKDKATYLCVFGITFLYMSVFIIVTVYNVLIDKSSQWWLDFWFQYCVAVFVLSILITAWLIVGGLIDLQKLFVRLRSQKLDLDDDGRVSHGPD